MPGKGGGEKEELAVLSETPRAQGQYNVHANLGLNVALIAILGVLGCLMRRRCLAQKKVASSVGSGSDSYGAVL